MSTGYSYRSAMLVSKKKVIVRDMGHYHLELSQGENTSSHCLHIALHGEQPHIEEPLEDMDAVKRFLREHDLPELGWVPEELISESVGRII